MSVRSFVKYWAPVVAWLLLIFMMSGDLLSAEHTSRFIGPFLRWFVPDITDATIALIQFFVRKCAHLTVYAILAALLWRALHQHHESFWRAPAITFVIAAVCASFDEFLQSHIITRAGSFWDILIDCAGAIFGLLIYSRFARGKRERAR